MSVKRSRQSESNFTEKEIINHTSSPAESTRRDVCGSSSQVMEPPSKCLKRTIEEDNKLKLWPNPILAPSSHGSIDRGFEDFLKYCHFCGKTIDEDRDLYMYGDLGAFCTEECRSFRMQLDKKRQKEYEKAKNAVAPDEDVKPMFF